MRAFFLALVALLVLFITLRIPLCAPAHGQVPSPSREDEAHGAATELPGDSIYRLKLPLVTQDGRPAGLDLDLGRPTIITMFYGSCPYACPTLIAAIQRLENKLDADRRGRLRVLLVSLDPDNDTPAALAEIAQRHRADLTRWRFAQTPEASVRQLAAVLGIQYRKLPDGGFNHSTVITLLDGQGRSLARTSQLNQPDETFLQTLRDATAH